VLAQHSPRLTRRQAIIGGTAVASLSLAQVPLNASGAPAAAGVSPTFQSFRTFSADFRTTFENHFIAALAFDDVSANAGDVIEVRFDPAFFTTTTGAFLTFGGNAVELPVNVSDGLLRCTLPVELDSTRCQASIALPLTPSAVYPDDGAGPTGPNTVVLRSTERTTTLSAPTTTRAEIDQACAPMLAVGWQIAPADGTSYQVPALVTVTNEGPGRLPSSTRLVVAYDPDCLALEPARSAPALSLPGSVAADSSSRWVLVGKIDGRLEFSLDRSLDVGMPTYVALESAVRAGFGRQVQSTTVNLVLPHGSVANQRQTGATSSSPRTDGGLPLVDRSSKGTN
jgi:hypothetical protein